MEMNDATLTPKERETTVVLANISELTASLIKRIAGNDISTAINGSPLTKSIVQNLVTRKIVEKVVSHQS